MTTVIACALWAVVGFLAGRWRGYGAGYDAGYAEAEQYERQRAREIAALGDEKP